MSTSWPIQCIQRPEPQELLRCRRCHVEVDLIVGPTGRSWQTECSRCLSRGPVGSSEDDAVRLHNMRTEPVHARNPRFLAYCIARAKNPFAGDPEVPLFRAWLRAQQKDCSEELGRPFSKIDRAEFDRWLWDRVLGLSRVTVTRAAFTREDVARIFDDVSPELLEEIPT